MNYTNQMNQINQSRIACTASPMDQGRDGLKPHWGDCVRDELGMTRCKSNDGHTGQSNANSNDIPD
jgi:hypothetical protein